MRASAISYLAILTLSLSLAVAPLASAEEPSAESIVSAVEAVLGPKNVKALYDFTNHRLDGTVSSYQVSFSMRHADLSHGYFLKPEREKGREVLRLGDDLWSYAPSVGRVIRLVDRDSFAGGDFSNADILRVDWLKNYTATILKDLPKQWIIELLAKGKGASYAKMRLWVDKATRQPVQQQYYDSQGSLLKRCLYGDTKTFGSITRPARLMMENVITKQKSELTVLDLQTDAVLPDSRFTVDNLGK